jgi:nitronate monooxygenase
MAGVQNSALTVAVSNAGGLGSLPCAMLDTSQAQQELSTIAAATSEPYNVNFFCHQQPVIDEKRYDAWMALLAPYFAELDLEPPATPNAASRQPFSHEMADAIEPFKPPIISFHFGLPATDLLQRVKGWGSRVWSSATTVDEAQWLAANGADAIIAQGVEAGGHRGMFLTDDVTTQSGTFALLPQIVNAVDVPVIAAGGIAGPQSVQAALSLGAAAVQCGTSYLLCNETNTTDLHRSALKSPQHYRHTALTNVFSGRPARGIVNRLMAEIGPDCKQAPAFPLASIAVTALRNASEAEGNSDFSSLWCGQNASGCEEISAAAMTKKLAGG